MGGEPRPTYPSPSGPTPLPPDRVLKNHNYTVDRTETPKQGLIQNRNCREFYTVSSWMSFDSRSGTTGSVTGEDGNQLLTLLLTRINDLQSVKEPHDVCRIIRQESVHVLTK